MHVRAHVDQKRRINLLDGMKRCSIKWSNSKRRMCQLQGKGKIKADIDTITAIDYPWIGYVVCKRAKVDDVAARDPFLNTKRRIQDWLLSGMRTYY